MGGAASIGSAGRLALPSSFGGGVDDGRIVGATASGGGDVCHVGRRNEGQRREEEDDEGWIGWMRRCCRKMAKFDAARPLHQRQLRQCSGQQTGPSPSYGSEGLKSKPAGPTPMSRRRGRSRHYGQFLHDSLLTKMAIETSLRSFRVEQEF